MYIPETYGSSAYAPIFEESVQTERKNTIREQKKRRAVTPRAKMAGVGLLVLACALLLLFRGAIIAEQSRQISLLNNELEATHAEVVKSELALNKEINLSYIEEYASTQLGMVRPSSSQEVYITIRQDDQSEVLTGGEETGFFATVGNQIVQVLEYLN